jgi:short-chain fatty acids transporter
VIQRILGAVHAVGERSARVARAIVPDPWIIAIGLAVVVLVAAAALERKTPLELASIFAFGFFDTGLLAFGFQMILVLMTGNAIANAPVVARAIRRLADVPTTSGGAAALTALVAMTTGLFNWGLGLVAGALLTREVARSFMRRDIPLNRGVVGAAGFLGIAVWHGGLSGSAPLKVAVAGAYGDAIPVTDTLFSLPNLIVTPLLVVALTALMYALGRSPATVAEPVPPLRARDSEGDDVEGSALTRLEHSLVLMLVLAVPLAIALVRAIAMKGAPAINLDWVILLFLVTGMVLHRSPLAYANAFAEGAKEAAGIVLQFPLYFGIIAVARDSGVVEVIARAFASLASSTTGVLEPATSARVFTYMSACVVNFLVPSGGAQWVVQSPLMLEMANSVGVDRASLVMPFAWGDQTTNLLQPFWALPLLSISGLRAKDVMGYTMLALVVEVAVILTVIVVLG